MFLLFDHSVRRVRHGRAAAGAPRRAAGIRPALAALCLTVGRWVKRWRQRRALREIAERNDRHLLRDIGVSQQEAFREANKWFWRA